VGHFPWDFPFKIASDTSNSDEVVGHACRAPRSEQRLSVDRDSGGVAVTATAAGDTEDLIRRPRYADNVQIFVGNLPHVFTDRDLRDYFES